jgi:hypothetical protein
MDENNERRERLEALQRAILRNDISPRHINSESVLLDIVRYLQTCVQKEIASRVDGYLGMLP